MIRRYGQSSVRRWLRRGGPVLASRSGSILTSVEEIHWHDENLSARGVIDFSRNSGAKHGIADGYRLLAPYDWTIAGDKLVGYGFVESVSGNRFFGFFCHQLVLPRSRVAPVTKLIMPFANYDFYMLGHPSITSIGEVAYFLYMDSYPTLFRFDTRSAMSVTVLDGLPGESKHLPDFRTRSRPPNEVFMEIEEFNGVPVGLYSQDGLLYSLNRESGPVNGSTLWTLTRMRPSLDGVATLGKMELPTSANHLSLLFGPESLVLFEKGAVEENGTQKVSEMVMISRSWYKDSANSPLYRRGGGSAECVREDHSQD